MPRPRKSPRTRALACHFCRTSHECARVAPLPLCAIHIWPLDIVVVVVVVVGVVETIERRTSAQSVRNVGRSRRRRRRFVVESVACAAPSNRCTLDRKLMHVRTHTHHCACDKRRLSCVSVVCLAVRYQRVLTLTHLPQRATTTTPAAPAQLTIHHPRKNTYKHKRAL